MKISLRKTKNIQATATLNFNFEFFFSFSYRNEDKNTSNSVVLNNVEKSVKVEIKSENFKIIFV